MTTLSELQHTPLAWGLGVGRDTGAIANNPRQFDDQRNLLFYDGAQRQRGGLGAPVASSFTASGFTGTDVCHVAVFKATAQVLYIVLDAATREVRLFTANLLGQDPADLASWGILNGAADTPPRFTTAESFGLLLLAHDEPNVLHRLPTLRIDPTATGALITPPNLRPDVVTPEDLAWDTFDYTQTGIHTKAAGSQAISGLTVDATGWGAMLVQIDAAGTITTKVQAATQNFDTEPLALAALPAPDAGHIEVGHVTIQALDGSNWVAGTNNFLLDVQFANFYQGPGGVVFPVTAALDLAGLGTVHFRGVYAYLGFMIGWGYGSRNDPDRPERVRISNGGDPAVYTLTNYFDFGPRGEPVIACCACGASLGVLKSVGAYALDGTDSSNWQSRLIDPFIGCVSVRAALNIEGILWWWSQAGPRRSADATTISDPGLALDLTGPEPATLPAKGPPAAAWAVYLADEKHIAFAFPLASAAATRAYVASTRDPTTVPLWNYWTLAGAILHAAIINADQVSTIAPGTASSVTTSGSVGAAAASLTVDWTQNDMVGDETWELWYQHTGGAWVKLKEFAYATVPGPTAETTFTGAPLVAGTYTVALRARRSGRYAPGYASTDPDDWPGAAKATGTIVVIPLPTAPVLTYSFITGLATLSWTAGDPTLDQEVQLFDQFSDVQSATVPAGTFTFTFPATGVDCALQARLSGTPLTAQVRHIIGPVKGAWVAPMQVGAFWLLADIFGFVVPVRATGTRTSVALGTDADMEFDVPPPVSGNWDIELKLGNYGAYLANGTCGPSNPVGGGFFFGSNATILWFTATYPDTEPSPVDVPHVASPPCATCLFAGQLVGLGEVLARWHFAQAGTLVHWTETQLLLLPGMSFGPSAGLSCTA